MSQFKTLATLCTLTLMVFAFQNCAAPKFSSETASTEKAAAVAPADDGTSDTPASNGQPTAGEAPTYIPDSSDGASLANNCRYYRALFEKDQIQAAAMEKLELTGAASQGTRYVHRVTSTSLSGRATIYIVGDAGARIEKLEASGSSHAVLCGVTLGRLDSLSGRAMIDVIGSSILDSGPASGSSAIRFFTSDGQAIK